MRAMNDAVSLRRHANRCEQLASRMSDPTVAQNLRDAAAEYCARAAACSEQVKSLVDKATDARERALQAAFPRGPAILAGDGRKVACTCWQCAAR